jgi:hypothetical protein
VSPSKREAIRRAKLKSRAKTGQTVKDGTSQHLLLDHSNSPSDEYYETTKISPASSVANSVYSIGNKGMQTKSSQSCRNTQDGAQSALRINKLTAVKESEEEQMTETFTRLKKKFTQPQQKEISKKNTPRQKRKVTTTNPLSQPNRPISRETNSRENTRRTQNRSKSGAKKLQNINPNFNFKIGAKKLGTLKHKQVSDPPEENQRQEKKVFNLPSINKNGENSLKFDHSLAGFATRSLSKNGSLKIKKAAIDANKAKPNLDLKNKAAPDSKIGFINQNALINVPKKYQFRGKRLNIDSQSITSSKNSKITTESVQKHVFHTKSGPIQVNEALHAPTNNMMR